MLFVERRSESKYHRYGKGRDAHNRNRVHPYASGEAVHEGRNERYGE